MVCTTAIRRAVFVGRSPDSRAFQQWTVLPTVLSTVSCKHSDALSVWNIDTDAKIGYPVSNEYNGGGGQLPPFLCKKKKK